VPELILVTVVAMMLTELMKRLNFMPRRYMSLVALGWGVLFYAAYLGDCAGPTIFRGAAAGLSAAGLHGCVKCLAGGMLKKI
jgi:hypothetical protein